jgi:hypothetical protein
VDGHAGAYEYPWPDGDPYPNAHFDRHPRFDPDVDSYPDEHADQHGYVDRDALPVPGMDGYADADPNGDPNQRTHPDEHADADQYCGLHCDQHSRDDSDQRARF